MIINCCYGNILTCTTGQNSRCVVICTTFEHSTPKLPIHMRSCDYSMCSGLNTCLHGLNVYVASTHACVASTCMWPQQVSLWPSVMFVSNLLPFYTAAHATVFYNRKLIFSIAWKLSLDSNIFILPVPFSIH